MGLETSIIIIGCFMTLGQEELIKLKKTQKMQIIKQNFDKIYYYIKMNIWSSQDTRYKNKA